MRQDDSRRRVRVRTLNCDEKSTFKAPWYIYTEPRYIYIYTPHLGIYIGIPYIYRL